MMKSAFYEFLSHMDTLAILVCSAGLWLSSLSNSLQSTVIVSHSTKSSPFFEGSFPILDLHNGSYETLLSASEGEPIIATLYYAQWDAESLDAKRRFQSLSLFSPLYLFGVDCWLPDTSCSQKLKLEYFPQFGMHLKNSLSQIYGSSPDILHFSERIIQTLHPIKFLHSYADLSRLLFINKIVVLGSFDLKNASSKGYSQFHLASLSIGPASRRADVHILDSRVDTSFVHFPGHLVPSFKQERSSISLILGCDVRPRIVTLQIPAKFTSDVLNSVIVETVKKASRDNPTCWYPIDITPSKTGYSNLLEGVLSSSPVLLLIGSKTSLASDSDPEIYLIKSLEYAYNLCGDSEQNFTETNATKPETHPLTKRLRVTDQDARTLLYNYAWKARQRHCKFADLCPLWWGRLSQDLGLERDDLCGSADELRPEFLRRLALFDSTDRSQSTILRLISLLPEAVQEGKLTLSWDDYCAASSSHTQEEPIRCVVEDDGLAYVTRDQATSAGVVKSTQTTVGCLFPKHDAVPRHYSPGVATKCVQFFGDNGVRKQTAGERPPLGQAKSRSHRAMPHAQPHCIFDLSVEALFGHALWLLHRMEDNYQLPDSGGVDARANVEQLHFMCCHFLHKFPDSSAHRSNSCLSHPFLTPMLPGVVDRLACGSNRTLQFHTLDSDLQPLLAWNLAGYNTTERAGQSGGFGVAIVDWRNEAVYRLEGELTYDSISQFIADFHASVLKPWRKHSQFAPIIPSSELDNPTSILSIRDADHLQSLLDIQTSIQSEDKLLSANRSVTNLVLLYYTRYCVHAAYGDSMLWHFEAVAQYFNRPDLLTFARVDTSVVDLPWDLRVGRVPSIVLFPANKSSYSSLFPVEYSTSSDLSPRLIRFILDHVSSNPSNHFKPDDFPATWARENSFSSLFSKTTPFGSQHTTCDNYTSSFERGKCHKAVQSTVGSFVQKLDRSQNAARELLRRLSKELNTLNSLLTSPFFLLYCPQSEKVRLLRRLDLNSDLWSAARSFRKNVSRLM
ncbi:unnamed protein product [Calicophoron daubneyi]|uniref:Thioredoxin domain-containing protein n=1 Tax=Calicophoron daubneyi TaxID=300641 RepID=A0AAV2TGG9_CALDB